MPRVFVPSSQIPAILGPDVHYLIDVLRMKTGDQLELFDGSSNIYQAKIAKIEKSKITCSILSTHLNESELEIKITLAQALPKARKMDLIIEKCTELGISRIIPMLTQRTIAESAKLDRWKKIALEAAKQSGRSLIPEISSLTQFEEVLKLKEQYDLKIIPWELEKENTLKKVLAGQLSTTSKSLLFLIGPEGGFSLSEIESAKQAAFMTVSLGKRILRTETAGMAVLAMLNYELYF